MTLPKNILHWSVADVAHWLEENHFQSEVKSFRGMFFSFLLFHM